MRTHLLLLFLLILNVAGFSQGQQPGAPGSGRMTTDDLPALRDSVNYTGYASYGDTQYTVGSPFSIVADTKVTLPNNAANSYTAQLPIDVDALYDPATQTITGRAGDGICWAIEIVAVPTSVAATYITFSVDIGGAIGEIYPATYSFFRGISEARPIIYAVPQAYTLDTFEANGGTVKVVSDGPVDIYAIRYVIGRTHKGRAP